VRQAKLGVSCRVKDPVEQGLTSHSYRVLQWWRRTLKQVRDIPSIRRKSRRWRRDDSNFNEPGNRDTNFCHQRTNNIIEAYTGNDVSHKEVRTSWSLEIAPLLRLRCKLPSASTDGDSVNGLEAYTRKTSWWVFWGSVGVHSKAWRVSRETHKNLGDPKCSCISVHWQASTTRKAGRQSEISSRRAEDYRGSD